MSNPTLPPLFQLDGAATLVSGEATLDCHINYIVELAGEIARTDTYIEYTGTMGGEAGRQLLDADGSGWALIGDAFAQVRTRLTFPDQVTIEAVNVPPPPIQSPRNFWDELARFDGELGASGTISGEWLCAPFFTDLGGFADDTLFADGTWQTTTIMN